MLHVLMPIAADVSPGLHLNLLLQRTSDLGSRLQAPLLSPAERHHRPRVHDELAQQGQGATHQQDAQVPREVGLLCSWRESSSDFSRKLGDKGTFS